VVTGAVAGAGDRLWWGLDSWAGRSIAQGCGSGGAGGCRRLAL